jgi:hypothetical protein
MSIAHAFGWREDDSGAADPANFSIVLGGPLYQLLRRAHMTGNALELARRRIVTISLVAWLPLLLLTALQGAAFGGVAVPFVNDVQVHIRFLVAVPLLVGAELLVHLRLRPIAQEFIARRLVPEESRARFREAVASAFRLRNSIAAEIVMIAIIYAFGIPFVWRYFGTLQVDTWYALRGADGAHLTLAGFWYALVSVPIFQFLLLRWYYRIVIWIRFLWQVSRIRLHLSALNGDHAAGLGFLSGTAYAFVPLAMAHGALAAATIANQIFYSGAKLADSYVEIAILVAYMVVLVFLPLLFFAMQVNQVKRDGMRLATRFAHRYARDFEAKWFESDDATRSSALGEADIQSLADMSNSLESIRSTRGVPITRDPVVAIVAATLAPIAPLLLTVIPAEELAKRVLQMVL